MTNKDGKKFYRIDIKYIIKSDYHCEAEGYNVWIEMKPQYRWAFNKTEVRKMFNKKYRSHDMKHGSESIEYIINICEDELRPRKSKKVEYEQLNLFDFHFE